MGLIQHMLFVGSTQPKKTARSEPHCCWHMCGAIHALTFTSQQLLNQGQASTNDASVLLVLL